MYLLFLQTNIGISCTFSDKEMACSDLKCWVGPSILNSDLSNIYGESR
jgi:hypothetical protein